MSKGNRGIKASRIAIVKGAMPEIMRRVDAGEGFKPVVWSMGLNNTTARKYCKMIYPEWYAQAVDGYRRKTSATMKKTHSSCSHDAVVAFVCWWVELLEKVVRIRNGKIRSYLAKRERKIYWSDADRERQKAKYNERSRIRIKQKYNSDPQFRILKRNEIKKWKALNPINVRISALKCYHKRHTKIRMLTVDSGQVIGNAMRHTKHKCYWCGVSLKGIEWHMDHLMPLCKGGPHAAYNIVKSCAMCNSVKSGTHPNDFIKRGQMVLL